MTRKLAITVGRSTGVRKFFGAELLEMRDKQTSGFICGLTNEDIASGDVASAPRGDYGNKPAHPRPVVGRERTLFWSAGTAVFKRHAGRSARIRQVSRQAGKTGRCARLRTCEAVRGVQPADGGRK